MIKISTTNLVECSSFGVRKEYPGHKLLVTSSQNKNSPNDERRKNILNDEWRLFDNVVTTL